MFLYRGVEQQAGRYVNAVGFLEDLCVGRTATDSATATIPGISPNLRSFNLVLATLSTAGKWKKALEVSAPMRGFAPSAVTSSIAAGGGGGSEFGGGGKRGGGGQSKRAGGVAAAAATATAAVAAVASDIAADGETYTHLIVACGKGGQPDK